MRQEIKVALHVIVTLGILLVLHLGALGLHLYYTLPWFDFILHLLGGVAVGFAYVLFISLRFMKTKQYSRVLDITGVFLSIMFVGIVWEIFEWQAGIANAIEGYIQDTSLDLVADTIGAFLAYLFVLEEYKGNRK
ncbi:MAG TPA: hypothetical protein PLF31_01495 [Candidatus Paceibacterota bacterium]|nr:hypothetical protein [Candidatus Paceibacterota bacterium]